MNYAMQMSILMLYLSRHSRVFSKEFVILNLFSKAVYIRSSCFLVNFKSGISKTSSSSAYYSCLITSINIENVTVNRLTHLKFSEKYVRNFYENIFIINFFTSGDIPYMYIHNFLYYKYLGII